MGCATTKQEQPPPVNSNPVKEADCKMKILVIGDAAVGKSSLISRRVNNEFSEDYVPSTTNNTQSHTIDLEVKGVSIELSVNELPQDTRIGTPLRIMYFRGVHGLFLVFDVNNKESFQNIPKWTKEVVQNVCEGAKLFLVGNKCDLEERKVTTEEIKKMAEENGYAKFFEVSCKTESGLTEPWSEMFGLLLGSL